jgi:hypothetical protein
MRITCLSAVAKLLMSLPIQNLYDVVNQSQLLGYISGFISSATTPVAGLSIMIAEMLLQKLPEKVAPHFAREGIVHEVGRLCSKESALPDPAADALLDYARQMRETMLGPGSLAGTYAASDELMNRAKSVAKRLDAGDVEALRDLRGLLSGSGDSLSSYQVLTSGLAQSLLTWLLEAVPERLQAFVEIFCGRQADAVGVDEGAAQPLRTLVIKLNEALSVREMFPVAIICAEAMSLRISVSVVARPAVFHVPVLCVCLCLCVLARAACITSAFVRVSPCVVCICSHYLPYAPTTAGAISQRRCPSLACCCSSSRLHGG